MSESGKICGIICEFNPFHKGHAYLIEQMRKKGAEKIVCAMSGNFVQRGEAAMFNKWTRAQCAVACGADLVVELPVSFAVSSAERFALGGVSLLAAAGCNTLGFGSEEGDVEALIKLARNLEAPEVKTVLQEELKKGVTFAAARTAAVKTVLGEESARLLLSPNNTLAISYLQAAENLKLPFEYITVKRVGASHEGEGETGYSATVLREKVKNNQDVLSFVPPQTADFLQEDLKNGIAPVQTEYLERAILAYLRSISAEELTSLPDISEGIENKLWKAAREACSLEELYDLTKSKRYTHARIRRMVLNAFLGIRAPLAEMPLYLKVLAANDEGLSLLKNASLPVITQHRQTSSLTGEALSLYSQECRADDLYALAQPKISPCGQNQKMNFSRSEALSKKFTP